MTTHILAKRTLSLTAYARKAVALASQGHPGFVCQLIGVATGVSTQVSSKTGESYRQIEGTFRAQFFDGNVEQSSALAGMRLVTDGLASALTAGGAHTVTLNARLYAVEGTNDSGFEWRVDGAKDPVAVSLPSFDTDLPLLEAPTAKPKK